MGSNPSKRVTAADEPATKSSKKKLSDTSSCDYVEQISNLTMSSKDTKASSKNTLDLSIGEARTRIQEMEKELLTVNQQMTELECQNLDLQDHIQTLEQQIEFNQKENEEQIGSEDFTETLKVKQQYIDKLEKEIESVNTEISKLRIKFKKRLRTMKTKFAESKNEGSMDTFENREEISKLKEENAKLKRLTKNETSAAVSDIITKDDAESGRMKIILDLSARVSEQDAKLTELENRLTEKDKHIKRLEKQIRQFNSPAAVNSGVVSKEQVSSSMDNANLLKTDSYSFSPTKANKGDVNWYTNKTFAQLSSNNEKPVTTTKRTEHFKQSENPVLEGDDEDDLKSIAAEISKLQMKNKKVRNNKKLSKQGGANIRNTETAIVGENENSRHSSGLSRDSGFSLHSDSNANIEAAGSKTQGSTLFGNLNRKNLGSAGSRASGVSYDSHCSDTGPSTPPRRADTDGIGDFDRDMTMTGGISPPQDCSDTETSLSQYESQSQGTSTPVNPSSIRQISGLGARTKRKKGYLVKNNHQGISVNSEFNGGNDILNGEDCYNISTKRPPVHRVKANNTEINEVDQLITSIDEDLLLYSKSNVYQAISVSSS